MAINEKTIMRLCELARLELDERQKGKFSSDLNNMIAMIDKLNELDTATVEPLLFVTDNKNSFREDVRDESEVEKITRDQAFRNAPQHDDSFFIVPRIIEK